MSDKEIREILRDEMIVKCRESDQCDKIKWYLDHIDFALDLVDDINDYSDEVFIYYSKKVEALRNEQ